MDHSISAETVRGNANLVGSFCTTTKFDGFPTLRVLSKTDQAVSEDLVDCVKTTCGLKIPDKKGNIFGKYFL